jgi:CotH protein/lamin tail-like protein
MQKHHHRPTVRPTFEPVEPRLLLAADVLISEFMAVNANTIDDQDGDASDWIELFNAGDQAQSLDDWSLTDNEFDPDKWIFPDGLTLGAGQRMLIFASDKDRDDPADELHTNFKLSGNGEYLALIDDGGDPVTEFNTYPAQAADFSYGYESGYGQLFTFIEEGDTARSWAATNSSVDSVWRNRTWDDSGWQSGPMGVGYERSSGYESYIGTDVETQAYDITSSVYIRMHFNVADASAVAQLQLAMRYDDGFVAYINGTEVARANAGGTINYQSAATQIHDDSEAVIFEELDISAYAGALVNGDNVLAIHGLNVPASSSDLLLQAELTGSSSGEISENLVYFDSPTPGLDNGTGIQEMGPIIRDVTQPEGHVADDANIAIVATVTESIDPVDPTQTYLHYRVGYGSTTDVRMYDDGAHGDGAAGDGIYGASIPAAVSDPGEMVRWYVTAEDTSGREMRAPILVPINPVNNEGGPEYFGTVVADPSVTSDMGILEWFCASPSAANTRGGTRSSLFFGGEFYDNVFTRVRGGSTAGQANPSHKFDMNSGYHFRYDPSESRSEEFNLNTMVSDKSYIRQILSWDLFRDSDSEANNVFPLRVEQNGQFYAVETFIEQTDRDFIRRNGYDDNGVLYKAVGNGGGLQADRLDPPDVEKKTHKEETSHQDLKDAVDAFWAYGGSGENYMFDNWNMASLINYMAVKALIQDTDHGHKNIYLYFDRSDTEEWMLFPWDHDLVWGRTQTPSVFSDTISTSVAYDWPWNRVISAVWGRGHPKAAQMFFARLRTLVDKYLNDTTFMDNRIAELLGQMQPEIDMTYDRWYDPWSWGEDQSISHAISLLQDTFIPQRASYFNNLSSLPDTVTVSPGDVEIVAIDADPVSGNQNEEYIEIENTTGHAIDVSGWRIESDRLNYTFRGGTVITGYSSMFVSPDKVAFRDRATGPGDGQMNFLVGHHHQYLNNTGGTVRLYDADNVQADLMSYSGTASPVQSFLRVTEVMYNPADASPQEIAAGYTDRDDFEFVELRNYGGTTLNLEGTAFTNGISHTFDNVQVAAGGYVVLARNPDAFQVRYPDYTGYLGEYSGSLDNAGEQLLLQDSGWDIFVDFTYNDQGDWPALADGAGASLQPINPFMDLADPANWTSSSEFGGSPGADPVQRDFGVVINEVLTHTDPPSTDSIELLNTTGETVDLSGWYLSDASGNLKFQIPGGTTLGSGDYLVFDETDFNPSGGVEPEDFALSSAHGDNVWLVASDAGQLWLADYVEFGGAINGESFGRWPNATGGLYPMKTVTLESGNSGPRVGPVLISEVMYNSGQAGGDDDLEFFEIHNPTDAVVDLTGWRVRKGVDYDFDEGTTLAAGETAVVVSFNPDHPDNLARTAAFRSHYGISTAVRLLGGYGGKLDNGGEQVQLQRPDEPPMEEPTFVPHTVEDEVIYDELAPWPGADGDGNSLGRVSSIAWGNDPTSWEAAAPSPGTVDFSQLPGDANGDGAVTDADYTIWADNYGASSASFDMGDFNGDGSVTDADYTLWADNYGAGAGEASTTEDASPVVVEPDFATVSVASPMSQPVDLVTNPGGYTLQDDGVLAADRDAEVGDLLAILSSPEIL